MANILELHGDLFESKAQTLVNTINCYGVMGKGIALEFKKRYPQMFKIYVEQCEKKMIRPGILYLYKRSSPWVLNFPTKNHWRYPSKLDYIKLGLEKFADTYKLKGIESIAFPQLGTLNGGLNWDDVRELMYEHLLPLQNLNVEIYHYKNVKEKNLYNKNIEFNEKQMVSDLFNKTFGK